MPGVDRRYATNGLNQYTSAGAVGFAYDANGNLTSDSSSSYNYDVENRLVSASGAANASLTYDPLCRLFQIVSGSGEVTQFLYDHTRGRPLRAIAEDLSFADMVGSVI